jgi:hypothetical protein
MKLKALALLAVFAGFAALASCETMSEEACTTADWRALGMSDANSNGTDNLTSRAESCARKGIRVNADAYHDGFSEGMFQFCQPERGFSYARGGGNFTGVCPTELDRDYRYAAADGRRIHELQSAIDTARSAISSAESRLRQNDEDMRDRRRALDAATTDEERNRLRRAIDQLRDERRDYNRDLRDAQDRLPDLDRDMSRLRYDIGDRWGSW